jgi:CHAT domain-containing protein/tetratricopeptide (TPR) repeat protein
LGLGCLAAPGASVVLAQSPFQFREAVMLESRMWHSGEDFSATHGQLAGREAASPANRMIPDADDLQVYRSARWLGLLNETDGIRRSGALVMAEKQYLDLLGKLRQAQGPMSMDIGWMLDRLGEFYLDAHDFDKAYRSFSDAVEVRRNNIRAIGSNQQQASLLVTCRAHLVKLLVAVGRLDTARGELSRAGQELSEAVEIGNELPRLRDSLDALYFQSQLLEKQGRWLDAEAVWQRAMTLREKMTLSASYWDLMTEMAAFYARRGDFHTAAGIVKRRQTETAGKVLKPALPIPDSLDYRQGKSDEGALQASLYQSESAVAMAEILAMDRWLTDGAEAAAPLFAARDLSSPSVEENTLFARGSGARRARWYAFLSQRAFLHMSVLLDGTLSPERIKSAYQTLQPVKGRYLDSMAELTRLAEADRDNPHVSYAAFNDPTIMLDELAADRAERAHFFVAAALDGKHFSNVEFAASEQAEQNVLEGLAFAKQYQTNTNARPGDPSGAVPPDAVFIDITAWQRTDRADPARSHREYGAFVARKGQPIRYVRLGATADIDADVAALESLIVGPHVRGSKSRAKQREPLTDRDDTDRILKRLYQEVIAPLESSIAGAKKLLIVPDGQLTLAPISAFSDAQGRYLLQNYTVSYLGSWRDLYLSSDSASNKTRASVVVANPDFNAALTNANLKDTSGRLQFEPLPNAELEGQDVQKVLGVSADRMLTGKRAREEAIRSLGGPQVLHFATHSVPNLEWKLPTPTYDLFDYPKSLAMDDPLLESVIVLAGGNRPQAGPEDGLLTGLEVASLRLSGTKLVVLSTCEAGLGTPIDGQGVLGLRAAFSMAGAEGMVMTLWPVDDKAGRIFMQYFYAHLDAGPAEAIRMAQQDMVAKTDFKQPQYWAGYAYSGLASGGDLRIANPEPVDGASESLVDPHCLEVTSHEDWGANKLVQTYRLKIATVHKSSSSPERVTYDLLPPASDLEITGATITNNGQVFPNSDVHIASQHKFAVSLTVERTKTNSSVYIREYVAEGDMRYKPQTIQEITLKGRPELFAGLDIPATFPPLSSYTEAAIGSGQQGKSEEKIDKVGVCTAELQR